MTGEQPQQRGAEPDLAAMRAYADNHEGHFPTDDRLLDYIDHLRSALAASQRENVDLAFEADRLVSARQVIGNLTQDLDRCEDDRDALRVRLKLLEPLVGSMRRQHSGGLDPKQFQGGCELCATFAAIAALSTPAPETPHG